MALSELTPPIRAPSRRTETTKLSPRLTLPGLVPAPGVVRRSVGSSSAPPHATTSRAEEEIRTASRDRPVSGPRICDRDRYAMRFGCVAHRCMSWRDVQGHGRLRGLRTFVQSTSMGYAPQELGIASEARSGPFPAGCETARSGARGEIGRTPRPIGEDRILRYPICQGGVCACEATSHSP